MAGFIGLSVAQPTTAGILPRPAKKTIQQLSDGQGGYTIIRQGERRADGFTTAAKVLSMPRLSPDTYISGVIHVKTKSRFVVNKDARSFQSGTLSQVLAPYSVKKIDAAFNEYNNGSLLSSDKVGLGRMYEVYYSSPVDAYDVCRELMNNPEIEYASPVFKRKVFYTPNDPKVAQQYELSKIKASQAWDITQGKAEVLIAITDTGVDWQHEDLAANIWTNPNEIPGNGKDDDSNGKIDDIRGWDFVGNITQSELQQGIFKEDNDARVAGITSTQDTRAHGTVVAGNAAAVTNNGKGVASIGHNCKIIPIKIASDNIQADGIFRGYEAVEYAARLGADIINCSWGGMGYSPVEEEVIAQASALGSLIIAASGNEYRFTDIVGSYPATYLNVLSVGATDNNDKKADFSNYGIKTSVFAPGVGLPSVFPGNKYVTDANTWSGTSFSSPVVAGIAGLVKSMHPDWTPAQIAQQIRMTSDNVVTSDASLRPLYYGRVNAYRAVYLNTTFNQGEQVPGVDVVATGLSSNTGVITNYQPVTLRLTLKNFLSNANNVQVKLQSIDGALSASEDAMSVGSLVSAQQKDIDIPIQLSENTPFFEGVGEFLVTITSGSFTNYHRLAIPFKVPSQNSYTMLSEDIGPVTFHTAYSPNPSIAWGAAEAEGLGALVFRVENGAAAYSFPSTNAIYCMYAHDGTTAYGGTGPSGGAAQILRTTNGAKTGWQAANVGNITPFVNNIHFFDANNGIFLGDPLNGSWGIGTSSNAGINWTKSGTAPFPTSGESGISNSAFWSGNSGWFGTSKGRVFRTTDKGQTWQASTVAANAMVSLIVFKDAQNGIAVYRASQAADAPVLAASTSDGGATWATNKFNFSDAGLDPVYAYNPGGSRQTAFLCSSGAVAGTEDNGGTWNFILTRRTSEVLAGAGTVNGQKVRLWNFGSSVGYLEYPKLSGSVKRELTLTSTVKFDTVMMGEKKTKLVPIRNTGETPITISAISIASINAEAEEFTLQNMPSLPKTLAPNSVINLQVIFDAQKEGNRTGTLVVTSDAEPAIMNSAISGIGKKSATSIAEEKNPQIRFEQVFPNPTAGASVFEFDLVSAQKARLTVINSLGQVLAIPFEGMAGEGRNSVSFDGSVLSSGVYYYSLEVAGQKIIRSFVISK